MFHSLLLCYHYTQSLLLFFFFFNATPPTKIYTLSLHDALPIYENHRRLNRRAGHRAVRADVMRPVRRRGPAVDRKSTRLNSSHQIISYAVFCLKKKKKQQPQVRHIYLTIIITDTSTTTMALSHT